MESGSVTGEREEECENVLEQGSGRTDAGCGRPATFPSRRPCPCAVN